LKKEDIIIIRITSAAILLAALALVLLFGAGFGLFDHTMDQINNSEYSGVTGSVYNMVFFNGVNTIYTFLFDLTLYTTVIGAMGLLLRLKGVSAIAVCGAVSSVVSGIYLILVYIFENNVLLHKMTSYIYLREAGNYVDGDRILSVRVLVVGIVLIFLGILAAILVKTSGVKKIQSYSSSHNHAGWIIMLPVFYGCIFMELFKSLLLGYITSLDVESDQVYHLIVEHYFKDAPLFHIQMIGVILLSAIIIVLLNRFSRKYQIDKTIIGVFFAIAYIIQGIIVFVHPPRLFGYLSFDEHICDVVDVASIIYMVMYALDIIFACILTVACLKDAYRHKRILITVFIHLVISILAIVGLHFVSVSAIFAGCAAVDLIALISLFYGSNVSAGNH